MHTVSKSRLRMTTPLARILSSQGSRSTVAAMQWRLLMLPGSERAVIELEYRGVLPMHIAVGARIDCLGGRIWITEEGGTDDIVLEAGESFDVARAGVAVVQALSTARFALRFAS